MRFKCILILMRNIPFLSILIITIFLLSVNIPAYSQDNEQENENLQPDFRYGFSLGIQTGVVYGQAAELVYPSTTKAEYLSELLWDMKPVFYLGLQADFNRVNLMSKPGFFASASFKLGIPGDTGIMEDRDWQSTVNDALTNFSSHTNKTREFYWADIFMGVSIPVKTYFYIKPFLSGSWMHFAFTARDGYWKYAQETASGVYKPIEDNPAYGTLTGNVIRYRQDWFLAAIGFSAGTDILQPFSFELFFQISPVTYCAASDNHLLTSVTYNDYSSWGLFIEPKIKIAYAYKNIEFSLEGAYRFIGDTEGPSYRDKGNTGYFYPNDKAGAGLSLFDTRFIFRYFF